MNEGHPTDESHPINDMREIQALIRRYCDDRDWDQFHSPKNLAIGLLTEAAELIEPLRFRTDEQCREFLNAPKNREAFEDEMADVLFFLMRLADREKTDLAAAFQRKMQKNAAKYPVEKFRGQNKKYDEV